MMQGAQAQNIVSNHHASPGAIHFALPAQPLGDALKVYGNLTQLSVLAQSKLIDNRVSAPVYGDYSADDALQRLLIGTGLKASFTDVDEAVIVPQLASVPPPSATAPSATIAASAIDGVLADGDNRMYAAMVQTRVTEALCKSPQTRPGSYRLVVRLRIDNVGSVVMSHLVGSTGLPERDAAIERTLLTLEMDSAPPSTLRQPITLLMRPYGNGVDTDCAQYDERG